MVVSLARLGRIYLLINFAHERRHQSPKRRRTFQFHYYSRHQMVDYDAKSAQHIG